MCSYIYTCIKYVCFVIINSNVSVWSVYKKNVNTNPTNIGGWTQIVRKGKSGSDPLWYSSCYSCNIIPGFSVVTAVVVLCLIIWVFAWIVHQNLYICKWYWMFHAADREEKTTDMWCCLLWGPFSLVERNINWHYEYITITTMQEIGLTFMQ